MAFHVHLPGMTMFDTLQVAASMTFTGRMTVVARSKIGRLTLLRGRIVAASVDGVCRVGERLLNARVVSSNDLQSVLDRQQASTGDFPVGLLVSTMGLADAREVRPIVLDQLREACGEILSWDHGSVDLTPDPDLEGLASRTPHVEISGFLLEVAHLEDLRVVTGPEQYGNSPHPDAEASNAADEEDSPDAAEDEAPDHSDTETSSTS